MQHKVTEIIHHLSHSHQHMASILEAKRQVTVKMAQIIQAMPDHQPELDGVSGLLEGSSMVTKSIVNYLNSMADFQEAIAENLTHVMKEIGDHPEE